jgi:endoglucanase
MRRASLLCASVLSLIGAAGCIPEGGAVLTGAAAANTPEGKPCPADGVIDDGEDNNNQISLNKGRAGYWYTFADKAGTTITPSAGGTYSMSRGGANGSSLAARASGKVGGGQVVYGGVGFNFIDPKGSYNASAYKGISFWAKVGEGSATKVRLKVPDVNTDKDGKVCTDCFNDFGMDLDLTTTWTKYTVPFSAMTQMAGWGAPHPGSIDTTKLYGVQWQVNAPGATYDLWVDDIAFTGCP